MAEMMVDFLCVLLSFQKLLCTSWIQSGVGRTRVVWWDLGWWRDGVRSCTRHSSESSWVCRQQGHYSDLTVACATEWLYRLEKCCQHFCSLYLACV